MKNLKCPICESENISVGTSERGVLLADRTQVNYSAEYISCADCGIETDVDGSDDKAFTAAHEVAKRKVLEEISSSLSDRGYSMSYIERAFLLPQRTISRWKSQGCSASGMALMNLVNAMPFLANIADHKFDSLVIKKEILTEATKIHLSAPELPSIVFPYGEVSTKNNFVNVIQKSELHDSNSKDHNIIQLKPSQETKQKEQTRLRA